MLETYKYINKRNPNVDWVVFVHGAGGSSSIWYKQLRHFKQYFNVLLLDLRGHGNSQSKIKDTLQDRYTFDMVSQDIIEVLDTHNVAQAHFVGISLGTILIRNIAEEHPKRVKSMIMGGAIMKMNFRSRFLMRLGNITKSVVPYILLYKLFAFIIMPRRNHKRSRSLFVNEAKKLCQKEFIRWFRLTADINPLLKLFRQKPLNIPSFYVMGEQDHLFLPTIKEITKAHHSARLSIIKNCGHVVNVEQARIFNEQVQEFINNLPNFEHDGSVKHEIEAKPA
jgi:pimeloyl-ACP methyl ester carboxylesterase